MVITKLTFRPATKKDIPRLVSLMNAQYQRKTKAAYFTWQYFESGYPTILICALDKDKLIGMFGLQKKLLNNQARVGQALDMLIRPEYRGLGIFSRLVEQATSYFKDLDLLCVFPNLNGKNAVVKTLGWKNTAKIANITLALDKSPKPRTPEMLFPKAGNNLVHFQYPKKVISWRFDKNPTYKYFRINTSAQVFAIVKTYTPPAGKETYGDIVYINCPENTRKLEALFGKAADFLKTKQVHYLTTWALRHEPMFAALKALGYKEVVQERYFCIKILNKKFKFLEDIKSWHFTQADTEFY